MATLPRPVLVVDFGAQYAQLIARRVREAHLYSEVVPHTLTAEQILAKRPLAIILSGGPRVCTSTTPRLLTRRSCTRRSPCSASATDSRSWLRPSVDRSTRPACESTGGLLCGPPSRCCSPDSPQSSRCGCRTATPWCGRRTAAMSWRPPPPPRSRPSCTSRDHWPVSNSTPRSPTPTTVRPSCSASCTTWPG